MSAGGRLISRLLAAGQTALAVTFGTVQAALAAATSVVDLAGQGLTAGWFGAAGTVAGSGLVRCPAASTLIAAKGGGANADVTIATDANDALVCTMPGGASTAKFSMTFSGTGERFSLTRAGVCTITADATVSGNVTCVNITGTTALIVGTGGPKIRSGTGSPNSAVTGNVGDIFLRTDGGAATTLYVKESGAATNTGWVAK